MNENSKTAAPAGEPEKAKTQVRKKTVAAEIYDWVEVFVVSIAVVFTLFAFVLRVAIVDGKSMNQTLQNGDKLLVSGMFYSPEQGDIVVCQSEFFGFGKPIVKRVIATAGQTISIDTENWAVYVDGKKLDESYVNYIAGRSMHGWSASYGSEYTVPEGKVFVMGDNRNNSWDSRDSNIGPIDERYIIGKAIARFIPLGSFKIFT